MGVQEDTYSRKERRKINQVVRWEDFIIVFIDNLPDNVSIERVRSVFSPYERMMDVLILRTNQHESY